MPIYEYVCEGCRLRFERYVRAWGDAVACPRCETGKVEKQLSRFALGSGTGSSSDQAQPAASGGACCGGSCGCAH